MQFRTEISIKPCDFMISYEYKIAMQGSCFAENIASKLFNAGFIVNLNPFGIVYNPLSLSKNLNRLLDNKPYVESELFMDKDIYHSFAHHSSFSDNDLEKVLSRINTRLSITLPYLKTSHLFIVTFGTAYFYSLQENGNVVSNCHKLPAKLFNYKRLTVDEIVKEWDSLIVRLRADNSSLKILFTVSPIRHWKDGAHENQLSKSILLLAVDELIRNHPQCYYFPSYEILLDELRDYRFYSEDMLHPSSQAVDYIWEKFSEVFFNKDTKNKIHQFEKIQKSKNHIPIIGR